MAAITNQTAPTEAAAVAPPGRLRHALVWSYVWTTGGSLVGALLQIGVTAILDPRSVGVMVLSMVWVSLALTLLQHGPTMAVIGQHRINDEHIDAAFWITMLGATIYAALFAAAAPLWARANDLPEMTVVCLALTPVVLLAGFSAIFDAVMRRRMEMRVMAIRGLTCVLVSGLAGLGSALAGLGLWALVIQQLVAYALYPIMQWRATPWKPRRPQPRAIMKAWREIRYASVQTLAGSVGHFIASKIDSLLMGLFFTPVAVGLYRFAGRLVDSAVQVTGSAVEQVTLPDLARHNDTKKLAEGLERLLHLSMVITLPALAVLATVAEPLLLVIGDQWKDAATPLRVLCAVSAVGVIGNLLTPALQAAQRPEVPAVFTWLSAATYTAGFLAAAKITASDGTIGQLTAVATTILGLRILLTALMTYVTYRRILHVRIWPSVVAGLPPAVAALAAAVVGAAVQRAVGSGGNQLIALLLCGVAAATTAAAGLLTLDARVRTWLGLAIRRLLPRYVVVGRHREPPLLVRTRAE